MVQSARVQKVVKGDDVTLTHQIMEDIAYNAELSRAPILVQTGDTVNFFYPLQDSTKKDLIGYPGVPVGPLPASQFTVFVPGVITPILPTDLQRGTSTFQSNLGQSVRAEITRQKATPTGDVALNSPTISNVSSFTGIVIGQSIKGVGIPLGTLVETFDTVAMTVTMTANATLTAATEGLSFGEKETHYSIDEVDVFERGFPSSLEDTSGGALPPSPTLNLP